MPKLTVLEQVRYLATLKGMDAKEVKEKLPQWMKRLEVKGKLTDKIKSLSKGNQQKIQLIITLIHEPDLIILDEPFSGLDPVNTELLKQVIFQEKERGATIIFSDHVMTNVEELCDDILMIRDGRVVLHGPVQDVRNQYGKTRLFVSSERSKEELENLPHVKQVSLTKQGSWKLILEDESAGRELFPILTQGQYIATFDQQAPTIDEIFKLESGWKYEKYVGCNEGNLSSTCQIVEFLLYGDFAVPLFSLICRNWLSPRIFYGSEWQDSSSQHCSSCDRQS